MMWQTPWPMRTSTVQSWDFLLSCTSASTRGAGDAVRHLIRVARIYFLKHGFTPSLPGADRSIKSSWEETLAVIGAAVFLHDLEDLVPEPHRRVHVVDADVDERGRDRLLGRWDAWRGIPCGWSSPRTESSGRCTWGVPLQKLRRHLRRAAHLL